MRRLALILSSVSLLAGLALPPVSPAAVGPATVIDGPANDLLDVDGTAMAPDGSGGIVYRKQVGGVDHVFAAQLVNGHWSAPMQVDIDDPYGASEPTIAAGSDGRLLVAWVQPRNVTPKGIREYELTSAILLPGASGFAAPVPIDANVGEPYVGDASAVTPRLAMAPDGLAYVVYRVVIDDCEVGDERNPAEAECRNGTTDKVMQVRVARFDFYKWSSLGAINREPQIAMLDPTASNAPSIGIDLDGDGVVAWQEPDSDGVARIWVRRLFGVVLGNVLQASPETIGGRPVSSNADSPAVAVSPFGEARIAYRILGAPGSAVASTQLFVNAIPSSFDPKGAQLTGASPVPGASQEGLGQPDVAIEQKGGFRVAWVQDGLLRELAGSANAIGSPTSLGPAGGQAETTINPAGGGTTAWLSEPGAAPAVEVREAYAQGAFEQAQLAGNVPGPVAGLSFAGSGQGDALLGWTQGPIGQAEVVGDFVLAPPAPFYLRLPSGWVRGRDAEVSWEASSSALESLSYSVYLDGKLRLSDLSGLSARLSPAVLGDGSHRVQVLATDASGQQTMSAVGILRVDANPPTVKLSPIDGRRGVRVSVRDLASGVKASAVHISFGDGSHVSGHAQASHIYRRPGVYVITAQVSDRVGNSATVHLRARIR
jgi:hypothetical protein